MFALTDSHFNIERGGYMQKDSKITASSFTDIKAKVKAEMQRRKYTGSVSSYGGTAYDYTTTPVAGEKVLDEHIEKIKTPLDAVNSNTNPIKDKLTIKELETTDAHITYLKSAGLTSSSANTGCMASCTGLCSTGCSSTCSGCTGCSGSCSGSCSGGCSGCSGCGSGCSGSCSGGCSGCSGCGSGCASSCSGCSGSCSGGCTNSCTGCGGTCSYSCFGTCSGSCTGCTGSGGTCSSSCGGDCASM